MSPAEPLPSHVARSRLARPRLARPRLAPSRLAPSRFARSHLEQSGGPVEPCRAIACRIGYHAESDTEPHGIPRRKRHRRWGEPIKPRRRCGNAATGARTAQAESWRGEPIKSRRRCGCRVSAARAGSAGRADLVPVQTWQEEPLGPGADVGERTSRCRWRRGSGDARLRCRCCGGAFGLGADLAEESAWSWRRCGDCCTRRSLERHQDGAARGPGADVAGVSPERKREDRNCAGLNPAHYGLRRGSENNKCVWHSARGLLGPLAYRSTSCGIAGEEPPRG